MKKHFSLIILLLLLVCSCRSRYLYFEKETPDIIPSDENFYNGVKSISVKTGNQNVVYNSNELSSSINVLINSIEKQLLSKGLNIVDDNADLTIEVLSIDNAEYSTNTLYKPNGKKQVYKDCPFVQHGVRVYLKTTRNRKFVNYTFYETPCSNGDGCPVKVGKHCSLNFVDKYDEEDTKGSYTTNAKNNPSKIEQIGRHIGNLISDRIFNKNVSTK